MNVPTARKQAVLEYVRFYWRINGYAPSIRDIMAGCGLSSTSVTDYNVWRLVEKGLLRREKGIPRSIREA